MREGLLVTAALMNEQGYSTALRTQYVAAGRLEQPVHGVFRRLRGSVGWEQAVISLQMLMRAPLVVGGRTALDLRGYGHYLARETYEVHLYGPKPPPPWLATLPLNVRFVAHNSARLFPATDGQTGKMRQKLTRKIKQLCKVRRGGLSGYKLGEPFISRRRH